MTADGLPLEPEMTLPTGVEVASIRQPNADKTRVQARNAHVPVVVNPGAGVSVTGTGL